MRADHGLRHTVASGVSAEKLAQRVIHRLADAEEVTPSRRGHLFPLDCQPRIRTRPCRRPYFFVGQVPPSSLLFVPSGQVVFDHTTPVKVAPSR